MSRYQLCALACMLFLGPGTPINSPCAEEVDGTSQFIEFFVGACLRGLPDIDRMKAAARALNWKPLDADRSAMFAPSDKSAKWQGWVVPGGDDLFLFGISEGMMAKRNVSTCVTVAPKLDQVRLVRDLEASLALKPIVDGSEAMQRVRMWKTKVDGKDLLVNLTTVSNSRLSTISLAGIAVDD